VGIGDALPPGAVRAMERRGPISSINWSLTLLGDARKRATAGGCWKPRPITWPTASAAKPCACGTPMAWK
jgi:hypothetical protein